MFSSKQKKSHERSKISAISLFALATISMLVLIGLASFKESQTTYRLVITQLKEANMLAHKILFSLETIEDIASHKASERQKIVDQYDLYLAEIENIYHVLSTEQSARNYTSKLPFQNRHKQTISDHLNFQWSGYSVLEYLANFIALNKDIMNTPRQLETSTKPLNDLLSGMGLKRLDLTASALEKSATNNLIIHVTWLVISITLLLSIIVIEGIKFYKPLIQKTNNARKNLSKEQDLLSKTRQKIEHDQDRVNLVMKTQNLGIIDIDFTTHELYISKIAQKLLKIDPLNDTTKTNLYNLDDLDALFDTDTQNSLKTHINDCLKNRRTPKIDLPLKTENADTQVWLRINGKITYSPQGDALRLIASLKDITTERSENEMHRMFTIGIESSDLAMAILDLTSYGRNFLYVSPGFSNLFGFSKDYLLKSNMFILNGPETKMESIDEMEAIMSSEQSAEVDIIHYKSDGTPFLDKMSMTPIKNDKGYVTGYITFHEDKSEAQKQTSKETTRQRLEAVGQISYLLSQQVLDLLNAPTGNEKNDKDALELKLSKIQKLHEDMLGFFSNEEERNQSVKIYDEIKAVHLVADSLFDKEVNIAFSNKAQNSTDIAYINRADLRQSLLSIIKNAHTSHLQAKKQGQIEISLDHQKLSVVETKNIGLPERSGHFAVITISDEGIGIDDDHKQKIFAPFTSFWQDGDHNGMGLTIAQSFINSWGGAITVEEEHDKAGASIKIYIPVFAAHEDEEFLEIASLLDQLDADEYM